MSKPSIDHARRVAKETGARRVVILYEVETGPGRIMHGGVSYGATRALCASTGKLLDNLMDRIEDETDIGERLWQEYARSIRYRKARTMRDAAGYPTRGDP